MTNDVSTGKKLRDRMLVSTLTLGILLVISMAFLILRNDPAYRASQSLNAAFRIINLVASEAPGPDSLFVAAAEGIMDRLDPYSFYLPPENLDIVMDDTEGLYSGIGIEMVILDGLITVVSPVPGSPAYRAGIRTGDRIVEIDGESARDITAFAAAQRIRGPEGSIVELTIERPGRESTFRVSVTRESIELRPVSLATVTADSIGYVRLTRFSYGAADMLDSVMHELIAGGAQSCILDLRGNPGGMLDEAVVVASCFLPEGTVVCETRGREPAMSSVLTTEMEPVSAEIPLVVLIDAGSASASEVVSAAIADHQRGVLVGQRSFGKGYIQSLYHVSADHAVQLTIGQYLTPGGYTFAHIDPLAADSTVGDGDSLIVPGVVPHVKIVESEPTYCESQLLQQGVFIDFVVNHSSELRSSSFSVLWNECQRHLKQVADCQSLLDQALIAADEVAADSPLSPKFQETLAQFRQAESRYQKTTAPDSAWVHGRLAETLVMFGGEPGIRFFSDYAQADPFILEAQTILHNRHVYDSLRARPPAPVF